MTPRDDYLLVMRVSNPSSVDGTHLPSPAVPRPSVSRAPSGAEGHPLPYEDFAVEHKDGWLDG